MEYLNAKKCKLYTVLLCNGDFIYNFKSSDRQEIKIVNVPIVIGCKQGTSIF